MSEETLRIAIASDLHAISSIVGETRRSHLLTSDREAYGGVNPIGGLLALVSTFVNVTMVGPRLFFPNFAIPATLPLLSKMTGLIQGSNAISFLLDEGENITQLHIIWAGPCAPHPCDDKSIITTFDKGNDLYHWYEIPPKEICSELNNKACTLDNAFKIMLAHPDTVAPVTSNRQVIRNCGVVSLQTLVFRAENYDNLAKTVINQNAHSVTNYTLPSHMFYPGFVVRQLVETSNHSIVMETIGTGSGKFRELNLTGGKALIWPEADDKLREYVRIAGMQNPRIKRGFFKVVMTTRKAKRRSLRKGGYSTCPLLLQPA